MRGTLTTTMAAFLGCSLCVSSLLISSVVAIPFNASSFLPLNPGANRIEMTTFAIVDGTTTRNVDVLGRGIRSQSPPDSLPSEATWIVAVWRCETVDDIADVGPFNLTISAIIGEGMWAIN